MGEAARGLGAPIPSQIADQLRSQEFRNFHGFRRAFWKAVEADPVLKAQFLPFDLHLMRRGKAPIALLPDRNGGRVKFEIHHLEEVAQGGAVYDMDNMVVMTPKRHIKLHGKEN
ncbi:Pyocin-S1 [compost metagenome]